MQREAVDTLKLSTGIVIFIVFSDMGVQNAVDNDGAKCDNLVGFQE